MAAIAPVFRFPGILGLLLCACFALMSLILWLERRNAGRDCGEQSQQNQPERLRAIRGGHGG